MALKSLFRSFRGPMVPATTAVNFEDAPAYAHEDRHALAQLAVTGTFGQLFYAEPKLELERTLALARRVEPAFLAKAAIHAREQGNMKDMPAVLLAVLSTVDTDLFRAAFGRVVTDGKMLRTFVQVMRSGAVGRKSLGTRPKAMVADWLNTASDRALVNSAVGNDPSLADVIKMVHPKPASLEREAFFAWAIGKPCDVALLPEPLRAWLAFKATGAGEVPDVPFQMLTHLPLTTDQWAGIARGGSWQMLRQNLNTFARHGVFEREEMVRHVAAVLRDPECIRGARAFPYQLMMAASAVGEGVPEAIRDALHDAMEVAINAVPTFEGTVAVCPDVSGSMASPATGDRKGATSRVRFVDVAALVAAAMVRKNPDTAVLPFNTAVRPVRLERRDTVMTNAARLAALADGGTSVSAPLAWLVDKGKAPDVVVLVSDNQSWVDASSAQGTELMRLWGTLKARNGRAKLVLIDIAPYGTTQGAERADIVNVGGFSDAVFRLLADVAASRTGPQHFTSVVEATAL
ncbi:RNA-binding protein [Acuticoccus sp. M5D2P5]|uniref:vWA domain-containing protein n=1 Tax=Acuticoccus kalidii TaxID=2910977 RepID=UPI001F386CF4|nr:RNA-binding protein [Acuticoccus kalidii]MCF3934391.1 RNA-binding protein [Acuticoccus kalidii]